MTPLLWVLVRLKILLILPENLLDTQIDISAMLGLLEALRVDGTPPTLLNALSESEKPITIQSNEPKFKESMKGLLRMVFHIKNQISSRYSMSKREQDI